MRRARLALTAVLAVYGGFLILNPGGEFIGFLGGTLMQLLIPAIFVAYFWRRGDRHAAMVARR